MQPTHSTPPQLRDALRQHAQGRLEDARKLIRKLPPLTSLSDRAAYVLLRRDLDDPLPDEEAALDADIEAAGDSWDAQYDRASALFLLERSQEALVSAARADALSGPQRAPAMLLMKIHLSEGDPKAAADVFLARKDPALGLLLAGAKVLGQTGHTAEATRLIDAAEPLLGDDRAEFDYVAAAIRGTDPATADQGKMAAAIFDKFAGEYDEVLASLGNHGPDMIADLLKALPIKRNRRNQVLDAGCGTGLCAKLLRPYAKELHGIDISAPMLEKAKKRNIYSWLTRSDLNQAATIPAGPFDLIVLADVLLYFGDLAPVLLPLGQRLAPGGWLLLTVEDGGALPAPGFQLSASGRHKHSEDHVAGALKAAGLGRPHQVTRDTLRYEFGMPIQGLAIAAQKPILAF